MYHHLITRLTWIPFPFVTYAYLFRLLLFLSAHRKQIFSFARFIFLIFTLRHRASSRFHLYRSRNDKKIWKSRKKAMINKLWIIVVRSIEKREGVRWRRAITLDGESDWRGGEQKRIFILCHRFFSAASLIHSFYLWRNACGIFYAVLGIDLSVTSRIMHVG